MISLDMFAKQPNNCTFADSLQKLREDPVSASYEYGFLNGYLLAASAFNMISREDLNLLFDELNSIYCPEEVLNVY